jgi:excisionase family DNA binding protein
MKESIVAPRYVRQREAAAHMGLNYHTFRHAVRKGLIPFYAFGGNKLFKIEELDAALQAFRVASTTKVLN